MSIPVGTKFQGIPPTNNDKNLRSSQVNSTAPLYDIGELSSEEVATLTLEGTTNASTSQAIYGVNLIEDSSFSDLATRLPDAKTGRSVVFINNSLLPILVFPSVVGGEINGVIDGQASIPNDGRAYTFYCTANPLPGAWTWSPPAVNQIEYQEMSINHTNGVTSDDFNAGQGGANDPGAGLGWAGGPVGGVTTTGTMNTYNFPAWATKYKCYTNIQWADITGGVTVQAAWLQGYQNGPSSTTFGQKITMEFDGTQAFPGANVQEVTSGPAYTGEVGDIGTLYMELPAYGYPLWQIIGNQAVGNPIPGNSETCYSQGFTTFGMFINSGVQTKLYKFKWFIEYS